MLPFQDFMMMLLKVRAAERAEMAKAPYNEDDYKKDLGVNRIWGEKGYTTNERTGIRPTLEVEWNVGWLYWRRC
ncbi:MAG: hypothetical protein V9E96_06810 [Chitinophagaceae bacterium]